MSLDGQINAYFVKTGSSETNEDFATAATVLSSHIKEDFIRHINDNEGYPLIASGQLTKRDVFIFDIFEGDFFQQLQLTQSLIIGPRCLLVCLLNNQTIPLGVSPVYTTSMRDLKISASGITGEQKEQLSIKIQWMGGYYLQNYGRCVTHLVSNTIKSSKYEHATLNGIPVMHVDWVQRVWERGLSAYITGTDEEFEKYRLPIFFDTNITSTGLDSNKKSEVMRLVQENGGTYHRAFRSQLVDIVITERGKTHSEKYQAAIRLKKEVLTIDWIFDSVKKGFALPTKNYQIKSLKVSTPTKSDQSVADFTATNQSQLSDISRISSIGVMRKNSDLTINETQQSEQQNDPTSQASNMKFSTKNLQREVLLKNVEIGTQYRGILEDISPREAKMAGNFLDGCCIYLSGFTSVEKEKLNRVLNVGGATRYDAINDEITHIIVGKLNDADFRIWKKDEVRAAVHIVRLDWLLESIKLKQTADENIYRVSLPNSREPDAPSPSSKKTLRSMNHSFKQPDIPIKKKLFQTDNDKANITLPDCNELSLPRACSTELPLEENEHELLAQYSQENLVTVPTPPVLSSKQATDREPTSGHSSNNTASTTNENNTEMNSCTIDYEKLDVFNDLIIYVHKETFSEELYMQMVQECEAAHANVVVENFVDPVDYAIVTFERTFDVTNIPVKANYVVTELYMEACMKENKLIPIEYFYKPIPSTADAQPLKGMTIVISVYAELEREFVVTLAKILGARVNEIYSKKEQPLLICPQPTGAKYMGAMKWRFPVVTSDWLLKCAEQGKKMPMTQFLVGDSPEAFPSPSTRASNLIENVSVDPVACEVTPLRNKRVSELVGNAKATPAGNSTNSDGNPNAYDSPHTPANMYGRAAYSFEFMEKIINSIEDPSNRELMRGIMEEIRANPTPEIERIKRQVCTPRRLSNSPMVTTDFCNTPEFKRRMAEELDKLWYLPTKKLKPSTPIDVIWKRVLRETCKTLGVSVSDEEGDDEMLPNENANENTTPSSNNANNIKSNRLSTLPNAMSGQETPLQHRSSLKSKIEPRTIFATSTSESNRKSTGNNTIVPNTQDVVQRKSNADISISRLGGERPSLVGKSTIDFDKISFEETDIGLGVANSARKSMANNSAATASPELRQIADFLKERESKRQSLRDKNHQNSDENVAADGEPIQPFASEQFCADSEQMVDWQDPIEFNLVKKNVQTRTMQYQGTPRFSMSCAETTKANIIAKIQKLGGQVSENPTHFDPECTHFICERPNSGEKILGCISSGKWVLSIQYIEDCYAANTFIDEELYEWGNSRAIDIPQISPDDQLIAQAAHRWRVELSALNNPNAGVFIGMRAILSLNSKNPQSLANVIKAGAGEIIEPTLPYFKSENAHLATHCFVDSKKISLTREDFDYLQKHGVKIASYFYIRAYLLKGSDANISEFEIKL